MKGSTRESGKSVTLDHFIAASEGRGDPVGRGLQLDQEGAGWREGVGLTPCDQVLVPETPIEGLRFKERVTES